MKEEKFIIIDGPTRDDLAIIFYLQYQTCIDPPFAKFVIKKNHDNDRLEPSVELVFRPTKLEYLDNEGQELSIAGYSYVSGDTKGHKYSSIYLHGHYNAEDRTGSFEVDLETYRGSKFKDKLDKEVSRKLQQKIDQIGEDNL